MAWDACQPCPWNQGKHNVRNQGQTFKANRKPACCTRPTRGLRCLAALLKPDKQYSNARAVVETWQTRLARTTTHTGCRQHTRKTGACANITALYAANGQSNYSWRCWYTCWHYFIVQQHPYASTRCQFTTAANGPALASARLLAAFTPAGRCGELGCLRVPLLLLWPWTAASSGCCCCC